MSEYYFDYNIKKIFDNSGGAIKTPKLYFERNLNNEYLDFSLFTVCDEWILLGVYKKNIKLPYDEILITYDGCNKGKSGGVKPIQKKYSDDYWRDNCGCRIEILQDSNKKCNFSGNGTIEMKQSGKVVAKFLFAINYIYKMKIFYRLKKSGNKLNLDFTCNENPQNIEISIVNDDTSLPYNICDNKFVGSHTLSFINNKCTLSIDIPPNEAKNIYSIFLIDSNLKKYYLLECLENNTIAKENNKVDFPDTTYICPYCHRTIDYSLRKTKEYKRGGVPCQGFDEDKKVPFLKIYGKDKKLKKNCIYCSNDIDLSSSDSLKTNFSRILPEDFFKHKSFKIALSGCTRAGKTTFISRFFGIENNTENDISLNMRMVENSMKQLNINVDLVDIPNIVDGKDNNTNWMTSEDFYKSRKICINSYPDATNYNESLAREQDFISTKYPFITEINNNYIFFYDVAGEENQRYKVIENISGGEYIGIFFMVNVQRGSGDNKSTAEQLKNINKNCPIAIIIPKFDVLENQFDSNCYCLRTDYFDGDYDYLNKVIDYSSIEIDSYLKNNSIVLGLDNFPNKKYFGLSSFNFYDSIRNKNNNDDDNNFEKVGKLNFNCSSKRMELPFVWMLKQFKIIN